MKSSREGFERIQAASCVQVCACLSVCVCVCVCGVLKNEEERQQENKYNLIEILVTAASTSYTTYYVTRK